MHAVLVDLQPTDDVCPWSQLLDTFQKQHTNHKGSFSNHDGHGFHLLFKLRPSRSRPLDVLPLFSINVRLEARRPTVLNKDLGQVESGIASVNAVCAVRDRHQDFP